MNTVVKSRHFPLLTQYIKFIIIQENVNSIIFLNYTINNLLLNLLNVILAVKGKTNKWLSEQLGKDPAIVSKWVTNTSQPNVEMLIQIAKCLDVKVDDLLRTE